MTIIIGERLGENTPAQIMMMHNYYRRDGRNPRTINDNNYRRGMPMPNSFVGCFWLEYLNPAISLPLHQQTASSHDCRGGNRRLPTTTLYGNTAYWSWYKHVTVWPVAVGSDWALSWTPRQGRWVGAWRSLTLLFFVRPLEGEEL